MTIKITGAITLLFLSFYSYAQPGTIEGFISDETSKTPLEGASISITANKGDNSDGFGKFSITAVIPGQYEMIVSHIGYKTEIIPVQVKPDLRTMVNVNLQKGDLDLSEVKINSKKTTGLNTISAVDIRLRPVKTSQDVLRIIPGLFIAQHAGGGKAEQIFLRGFDLDHGSDIAIAVDGIPVNMVSHAHGQGYADLHFLIPETVEKANFDKGPYLLSKGNLATAGWVDFSTKEFIDKNSIKAELGQFNTRRVMGMLKIFNKLSDQTHQQLYLASEYSFTDGYFDNPQDFHRLNLMGKYTAWFDHQSQVTVIASTFGSHWNASGQIPDRAVRSEMISRFGSIDNKEGGNTSRSNLSVKFSKQWKNDWKTTDQFYFIHYKFNLFSDFTFWLKDTANGDMINQNETRNVIGYLTTASKSFLSGNRKANMELGSGFRYDNITPIELAKAPQRVFLSSIRDGDIKELNSFFYIQQDIELDNHISLDAGIRYDHFNFKYRDRLGASTGFAGQQKDIFCPRVNISYSPCEKVKLYLNNGIGFHSNDTRVILDHDAHSILPKVFGTDLGLIWKPGKNLILKSAFWHLYSQQEFVYVGDEGIVAPSGKTRRFGIDLSARQQFNRWLFGDADINWDRARAISEPKGKNYVPLAPSFSSIGGLTARSKKGFSGSLRYRFIGDRPANETNSIRAEGYFLLDLVAGYRIKQFDFTLSCENLLNCKWREAQFDTESRLKYEINPVEEIHYTSGTPCYIKAAVIFSF